ncbi:hypothetical protein Tco_1150675 [Tanacetum coccineum]
MTTKAQQSALDNALVALENQRVIGKCNMRINPEMKPKEPTYQVVFDALALKTCYPSFLITAEVPVIYMHQFWATVNKHNSSYRFKIDNKRFFVNVEVFRDILNICPRVPRQEFDEPPSEEEALSFISELSHSGEIKYITDYKKNLDFVALIWEDLAYQIDNKDSKKHDKMFYPRFTKIIIHHFLEKDKSISMRNITLMHTARDDSLLGTMRFVSRHEDTQVYGVLLPKAMTNQAMLNSDSYKTYYAIASGAEPPKSEKPKRKYNLAISSEETPSKNKPTKSKKDVPPTKKPTTNPKPTKKKAPVKANKGKRLNVLLEVALFKAAQLKKISCIEEGIGAKPGVPNVPKYDYESDKESWGDSGEEDDDDEHDTEDDEGNYDGDDSDGNEDDNDGDDDDDNDDDDDGDNNDGNDDDSDHERTESDRDENPNLNQFNEEHEEEEEENVNEFTDKEDDVNNDNEENEEELDDDEELYKDVNVNLRKEDVEMIDVDQSRADQHNVFQESGFE